MSRQARSDLLQVQTLVIAGDDGYECTTELTGRSLRIGRGPDNDLVLVGADKGVSRTHAELRCESGSYVIVDLQSQNGTWVNGRRVQRAEILPDTEIDIGRYRLRLQISAVPRRAAARDAPPERAQFPLPFVRPLPPPGTAGPAAAVGGPDPAKGARPRRWTRGALLGGMIAATLAAFAIGRFFAPSSEPAAPAAAGQAASAAAPSGSSRAAALQARYTASRAALERRDFVAAAAGFDALLKEAPGFMDTPQLLVEAREGVRGAARAAAAEGDSLDRAGDWLGALRKYGEAHGLDPATPKIDIAVAQVWEKMRVAGHDAFARADRFETEGRLAEALDGYERAAQWLPVDDPVRAVARTRADRLRTRLQ